MRFARLLIHMIWALWLVACASLSPPRPAADCLPGPRPAWQPVPPAGDGEWLYGVGAGSTRDASYMAAAHDLARSIRIVLEGTTGWRWSERNGEFSEEARSRQFGIWSETVRDLLYAEPPWCGPDGRIWTLVKAPKADIVTRRVEEAVALLRDDLRPRGRIVLVPPFERSGVASDFGALLAGLIADRLHAAGVTVARPRWPTDEAGLDQMILDAQADTVLYGVIDATHDGRTFAVELWAVDATSLSDLVASARIEVPAGPDVWTLNSRGRSAVPDAVRMLVVGLARRRGPVAVEVRVDPSRPVVGEVMSLRVRSSARGYLTVLAVLAGGGVVRLAPMASGRPVMVQPGAWFHLPRDVPGAEGLLLRALPAPVGMPERIVAVVTAEADDMPGQAYPVGVGAIPDPKAEGHLLLAIDRLSERDGWGAASAWFTVEARPPPVIGR